jgi:hypothetical protein
LVLAGREDAVIPPERRLEMAAAALPEATLVLAPRERPDAVTRQLLAWLQAGRGLP